VHNKYYEKELVKNLRDYSKAVKYINLNNNRVASQNNKNLLRNEKKIAIWNCTF
jgi:hypothetical protein